jgi:hypothetical protein
MNEKTWEKNQITILDSDKKLLWLVRENSFGK